jgi:hypothetical protein
MVAESDVLRKLEQAVCAEAMERSALGTKSVRVSIVTNEVFTGVVLLVTRDLRCGF